MKVYIRTLWGNDDKPLWDNIDQREALRRYLNDEGFYTVTGAGDSLEVHAIDYTEPWDIKFTKKVLDKLQKSWYTLIKGRSHNEPN